MQHAQEDIRMLDWILN